MDPVQKALWFVESHSGEQISLDDIAQACKVSPFHLTRAAITAHLPIDVRDWPIENELDHKPQFDAPKCRAYMTY